MLFYSVAGLILASEVPLPGLAPLTRAAEAAAAIRLDVVPDRIAGPTRAGPNWALNEAELLLSIPGLASFLLTEGKEIRVQLAARRRPEDAAPFLAPNLLGLLMQQRGRIVLRASSVAVDGRALLLCGDGAAGKSTFAAAMTKAGYRLLGDDFCTIEPESNGAVIVHGDGARPMLWIDAIDALGLSQAPKAAVREGIEKYHLPQPTWCAGGLPLAGIYSLGEDPRIDAPRLEVLRGMKAVQAVRENVYRALALGTVERRLAYFRAATNIAARTRTFRLTRGSGFDWIDEGLALVAASLETATTRETMP